MQALETDVTRILRRMKAGDELAPEELLTAVYDELRRLAAQKMARERLGQTLQPTALVHEAWLKLGGDQPAQWDSRGHFFAAAAEAMRRILIDKARRRQAMRHGGGQPDVEMAAGELVSTAEEDAQLMGLNDALERLALADPKKAELVKLRYFVGLTLEESAETLGISIPTAKRWWTFARSWLYREVKLAE